MPYVKELKRYVPAHEYARMVAAGTITAAINSQQGNDAFQAPVAELPAETDEEIAEKLSSRFEVIRLMTQTACEGECRALIISGPAGLGKSFTVEEELAEYDGDELKSVICKGFTRATGLYRTLYKYRHPGNVVVFDDCDSVFFDADALNLLKAACDTTERRRIMWGAETRMQDDDGSNLPTSFDFEGSIILITNYDFDRGIESGNKLADHFKAMISRSHYIDTCMKSKRDYLIRIKQVCEAGMLASRGLSQKDEDEILNFIFENSDELRELTLRMVIKIAGIYKSNQDRWQDICKVTVFKAKR